MGRSKLNETFSPDFTDDIGYIAELRHETLKAHAKERGFEFPKRRSKAELIKISKYLEDKDFREFASVREIKGCKTMSRDELIDAIWCAMEERPRISDYMHFCVYSNLAMARFLEKERIFKIKSIYE